MGKGKRNRILQASQPIELTYRTPVVFALPWRAKDKGRNPRVKENVVACKLIKADLLLWESSTLSLIRKSIR